MKETTEVTATNEHQARQLVGNDYHQAVQLNAELGYALGQEGDYRLLTATMNEQNLVLFEAVSGTDRYPPGRNMHVSLSMDEFDTLVLAVQQFRAEVETKHAQEREALEASRASHLDTGDDFDPFLDDHALP